MAAAPSSSEVLSKDLWYGMHPKITQCLKRAQMLPVSTHEGPLTKSALVLSVCHPDVALALTLTHSKVSARKQRWCLVCSSALHSIWIVVAVPALTTILLHQTSRGDKHIKPSEQQPDVPKCLLLLGQQACMAPVCLKAAQGPSEKGIYCLVSAFIAPRWSKHPFIWAFEKCYQCNPCFYYTLLEYLTVTRWHIKLSK